MKRTQDLSIEEFDLFARCVEAAIEKSMENRTCFSAPVFQINRIERALKFRYKYIAPYNPNEWNWTFDSEEGLSGPGARWDKVMKQFYIVYKLLTLYFLDDESLLDEMWSWQASKWAEHRRANVDRLYKIKAEFLGAHCSGDNHCYSELEDAFLYKVRWVTHKSEIKPDFTRVLSQHEHISLTRYSVMYQLLYEKTELSSGKAMGVMRKIDEKIDQYVKRRLCG